MSIWSKILIGFIAFMTLGMMYAAAKTLKIHSAWMQAAQKMEAQLPPLFKQSEVYVEGDLTTTPPTLGIRELSVELHKLMVDRGRVWYQCVKTGSDAAGNLALDVESMEPGQIQEKMVLYVFSDPQVGGYLGEFSVTAVADKKLQLAPTMQLIQEKNFNELTRIQNAPQGPLTIYERMPADRHEIYTIFNNDEKQLAIWMPTLSPLVLEEFVRDGTPARPDDLKARIVDGKYERQLRDYAVMFHELHGQVFKLKDEIATATTDKAIAEQTHLATQAQFELRTKELDEKLKPEFKEVSAERDLMTEDQARREARLAEVTKEQADLLAELEELNTLATDLQIRVAERLNELIEADQAGGQ